MLLENALKKIKAASIKLQYIFASQKVKAIAIDNEGNENIVNNSIPSTLSDMAIKKLSDKYPNAKFLDVTITKEKIEGHILLEDGKKEVINLAL